MKITYSILALLFIALLWTWTQMPEITTDDRKITELPWIIKTDKQGDSSVFGLAIERATVSEAQRLFKIEPKFGIFLDNNGNRSLEAFFNNTYLAGLQARITLTLDASEQQLDTYAAQSIDKKPQPSNSYMLVLPDELTTQLLNHTFTSITYQPKIKIEHDILRARFGSPTRVDRIDEDTRQWHYPEKGLLMTLVTDEKPVFHYVRPASYKEYIAVPDNNNDKQTSTLKNIPVTPGKSQEGHEIAED